MVVASMLPPSVVSYVVYMPFSCHVFSCQAGIFLPVCHDNMAVCLGTILAPILACSWCELVSHVREYEYVCYPFSVELCYG